jgi:hypothetical protein
LTGYFSSITLHGFGSRVRLELLHAERDLALALVHVEHDRLDVVADRHDLRRMLDPLGPGHLGDVDQALDARLELDEGAVFGERHDLAADPLADRVAHGGVDPRVRLDLLEAERHALRLGVELQDLHLELVAHVEQLARVIDASPGHVRHVEQAVDPAEVDEGAVVREVLDDAVDDLAGSQRLERRLAELLALGLEQRTTREHDVGAALVELDDLEREPLADHVLEVAHGAQVHLRAGQERLHADVHGEATLDPRDHGAFDGLVGLVGAADLVPDLEAVRLLLRQDDAAVFAFGLFEQHVDFVPGLDEDRAVVVHELPGRDQPLGLEADVDLDLVVLDGHHRALDDFALLELRLRLLEELREGFGG